MSDREELVKAIAGGRQCGGGYSCGPMADDVADAGRDLDAHTAEALRGAAQTIRDVANRSSGDGYYAEATAERACAKLLEDEADRLTEGHVYGEAHTYLSTSCHHRNHSYCQSDTGAAGTKKPGECKLCAAPCTCRCHTEQAPAPCGDVRPLGLLGEPVGPCILVGRHLVHKDLNGTCWSPRPDPDTAYQAEWRAFWDGVVRRALQFTDVPDTFKGKQP